MTPPAQTLVIERHHRPRPRSRLFTALANRAMGRYIGSFETYGFGPELFERTAKLDALSAKLGPPRGTRTEPVDFGDFAGEWVHGPSVGPARDRVILYLHGGGWFFGGLNSHRRLTARISASAEVPVLAIDYRMIPAVPFETEVEDCLTAYQWLLHRGVRAGDIAIMGDSAGGHLSFATALGARDQGLPPAGALVSLSGCLDLDLDSKHAHENATSDRTGSMASLQFLIDSIAGHMDLADPAVSPIRGDLAGLPPTLLVVSSTEVLFEDSERMARRLADSGVRCVLQIWDQQLHVFQAFAPLVAEADKSITRIGTFVRATLSTPAPRG